MRAALTMRHVVASLFLFALIALCKGDATAQDDEIIRVTTREVFFEVLVRDKRTGAPVADLTAENFELLDNGKPRQLSYFSRVGDARKRPLALILVLDLRPDGAGRFLRDAEFAKSLAAPISQLPQDDEVAVLAVSVQGQWGKWKWLTELTRDRADITTALTTVPRLVGEKKIFRKEYQHAFGEIVEDVARMATQRRPNSQVVLVLVSDSINTLDGVFFTDREKIGAKLLRANLTFSALTHDLSAKHKAVAVASKPIFILARASLTGNEQHFATLTGGEALNVNTPGAFAEGLERIVGGLTARYSLAFKLDQDVPNDGRLHRLEVKVKALDAAGKKRKLQVSARRGYYLPQNSSAPAQDKISKPTNNAEAEQAIRKTLFTLEYAYATGDVETIRRLTAKRTLDVYRLCFSLLSKDSAFNTSNDELFAFMIQAVAGAVAQTRTAEEIKKQAQKNADRPITFIDEKTARIAGDPGAPPSLAVLEDGIWKIDDTETVKEDFLKSDGLTPADKKRITSFDQDLTERLDNYVQNLVKHTRFSGTVLVLNDDRILLSKGFGSANIEQHEPNTVKTHFRIGSLTKQFTAAAILMLQERGTLNVQDSICRYLPQCPGGWEQITIHHLLTHTSGLPDASYLDKVELPLTANKAIAHLRDKPLRFTPGARFSYGSTNYVLLGYIIEKVAGRSYEAFLRENIIGPLGLTNTGYDHKESALKYRAAGYSLRGEKLLNASDVEMSMPFAAGGLYSTAEDLHRWLKALVEGKLLPVKSLAVMWTPSQGGYGYGWYVTRLLDRRYIYHGGWINGFAAAIGYFPDERITVIVLSNVDSAPVNTMARDLAGIAMGAGAQKTTAHQRMKVNPAIYDDYVGRYELSSGVLVVLTKENDKLIGRATGYPAIELLPETETTFFVNELGARITFVKGERLATRFILRWDQQELTAKRIPEMR